MLPETLNWRGAFLLLVPIVWGAIELSHQIRIRLHGRVNAGQVGECHHPILLASR